MSPRPGDPVQFRMTKWPDRPHWTFDALWLGGDEHGDWFGIPAGTEMDRPGAHVVSPNQQMGLVPPAGAPDAERWWAATFHDPVGAEISVYVDIATPPVWDGTTARTVDLDLDVIRDMTGRVWVDDEDEFAQHRIEYDYPDELIRAALSSCERVYDLVARAAAPYDGSHQPWLARLRDLLTG